MELFIHQWKDLKIHNMKTTIGTDIYLLLKPNYPNCVLYLKIDSLKGTNIP